MRETILPVDGEYHEGNAIDEQHVLDEPETASDYERGLKPFFFRRA